MALTLQTNARNAAANAVTALLNGGTIDLLTAGAVVVASVTFGSPAFANAAVGVATANAITDGAVAAAGTVATFTARTSGAAAVLSGTVTATGGGGDLTLSALAFVMGDIARITSLTYTQPAT